jgi:hypothetical protein
MAAVSITGHLKAEVDALRDSLKRSPTGPQTDWCVFEVATTQSDKYHRSPV